MSSTGSPREQPELFAAEPRAALGSLRSPEHPGMAHTTVHAALAPLAATSS